MPSHPRSSLPLPPCPTAAGSVPEVLQLPSNLLFLESLDVLQVFSLLVIRQKLGSVTICGKERGGPQSFRHAAKLVVCGTERLKGQVWRPIAKVSFLRQGNSPQTPRQFCTAPKYLLASKCSEAFKFPSYWETGTERSLALQNFCSKVDN